MKFALGKDAYCHLWHPKRRLRETGERRGNNGWCRAQCTCMHAPTEAQGGERLKTARTKLLVLCVMGVVRHNSGGMCCCSMHALFAVLSGKEGSAGVFGGVCFLFLLSGGGLSAPAGSVFVWLKWLDAIPFPEISSFHVKESASSSCTLFLFLSCRFTRFFFLGLREEGAWGGSRELFPVTSPRYVRVFLCVCFLKRVQDAPCGMSHCREEPPSAF